MKRAGPIWKRIIKRTDTFIRQAAIAGGGAGAHTVTGIKVGDKLVSVIEVTTSSAALADRTSEFIGKNGILGNGAIMTKDNVIDNTGGTDTTGDALLVTWEAYEER